MSGRSIGKFAVVYVVYGGSRDEFPAGILGVYDTLAEAAQDMLADIHDGKDAYQHTYCEAKYTTTTGELWYDEGRTRGCRWKVVEI